MLLYDRRFPEKFPVNGGESHKPDVCDKDMVASWAAADMGWKESAACLFTVGAIHYLVVFITLY